MMLKAAAVFSSSSLPFTHGSLPRTPCLLPRRRLVPAGRPARIFAQQGSAVIPIFSVLHFESAFPPSLVMIGAGGGEGEVKAPPAKKKFITREEEPAQYWQTAGERKGENPMTTPLPYIIIFGMSTPFVILAIAFANGWIKVPVR